MVKFQTQQNLLGKKGESNRPSRLGKNKKNNQIKRMVRTNERRRYSVEMIGRKMNKHSNKYRVTYMAESRYGRACRRPMRRVWVGNKTRD
jgi:hypothetical protein